MAGQVDFLGSFIASNGAPLGVTLNGFSYIPYGGGMGGLVMGDSAGGLWLLQIGTDGRLTTTPVTF